MLAERQRPTPETVFAEGERKGMDPPDTPVREFMEEMLRKR